MSILDVGAGAANGLETLLARARAEELLRQHAATLAEETRHNRADESLRGQQITESAASRKDTFARQLLNDMQGDASKREAGYGISATMGPKGVTFNEPDVPRAEAQQNMNVLGSTALYHDPNVATKSTLGVMPLIGASGPTAQTETAGKLTEQTPTMLFRGTGAQRLGAQKEAETEYKNAQPKQPTPEEDKAKAVEIRSRLSMGKPVTPDEQSWLKSHEVEATLGPRFNADNRPTDPRLDRSYDTQTKRLDALEKPLADQAERIGRLRATIKQMTPAADALIAPELLTAMAGGAGSGLRMNEAEISRIVGGRTQWESLKAKLNAFELDPSKPFSVTDEQRRQMRELVKAVAARGQKRLSIIDDARSQLIDAGDVGEHRRIVDAAKKALNDEAYDTSGEPNAGPPDVGPQQPKPTLSATELRKKYGG